jgi:hypothetical protein
MMTRHHPSDQERFDLTFGRGGHNNKLRRGTVYRDLISQHYQLYAKLTSKEKGEFARVNIVDVIQ